MATQSEDTYGGEVYPATAAGFKKLLSDANDLAKTYKLVTVVRLDKALASIYERRTPEHEPNLF